MTRNGFPAKRTTRYTPRPAAASRFASYMDVPQGQVVLVTEEQLAAYQAEQRVLRARWKARQDAIKARDRKVMRFWLGFGAVIAAVVLIAVVVAGWLLWTAVGLGVLALPVLAALLTALGAAGHRCITVVQHWH